VRRLIALGLAAVAACSGDDQAAKGPASSDGCFLAFNPAFDGFRSWTSYAYDGTNTGDAGVHVSGPRTEYINALPAHGSTTFPVGTIIAKEVGANDPSNHHIFAMVKRGCDYDSVGAKGWEWMEITEVSGGATIKWRGLGPPAGEVYGGDPNGCSSCHVACGANDDVCSTHIVLSNL
jgi:hypothetical protein